MYRNLDHDQLEMAHACDRVLADVICQDAFESVRTCVLWRSYAPSDEDYSYALRAYQRNLESLGNVRRAFRCGLATHVELAEAQRSVISVGIILLTA